MDPGDRSRSRDREQSRDFNAELDRREQSAKSFFVPARANLDVGDDLDPVELGLVTFDESESLFSLYVLSLISFFPCFPPRMLVQFASVPPN